jgi:hypothetical protein
MTEMDGLSTIIWMQVTATVTVTYRCSSYTGYPLNFEPIQQYTSFSSSAFFLLVTHCYETPIEQ